MTAKELHPAGDITPGMRFGRWLVMDGEDMTPRGERRLRCRCDCGEIRFVLERSLKYGASRSCGCLRKEALRQAVSHDLKGQVFGKLTVIAPAPGKHLNGGAWWLCQCTCGGLRTYPATLLSMGKRTHCGCQTKRHQPIANIAGRRFGALVAVSPTDKRDRSGSVVWECRCDCGNQAFVPYNSLMYANHISCGCKKKAHNRLLSTLQTRLDGTSLDLIKSSAPPRNSTTGVRGVYLVKGRYVARLVFRKQVYHLGAYDTLEEAAQARKAAEEDLYGETLRYYELYRQLAEKNPAWAEENPVQISVQKQGCHLTASFLPELPH